MADARDVLGRDLTNLEADLVAVQKTRVDLELIVTALRDRLRRSYRTRDRLAARNSELKLKAESLARRSTAASDYDTTLEKSLAAMAESYEQQLAEMRASYHFRLAENEKSHDASRATAEAALEDTLGRGARLKRERDVLRIHLDNLEGRLASASKSQQAVLQRLTERALTGIESLEKTIAMTEAGIDTVLAPFEDETDIDSSRGGPFLPSMLAMEGDPLTRLEESVNLLDVQMNRWDALQQAVRGIPLAMPLDQYRISSSFGSRLDPINGKKAQHKGMDLSAPKRTPVMSTAPGTVVFAGSRGDFGRVVEIDHGNGIRTLYGHLHKILVKVGQEIGYREKIALLGNSGRSTGPHVHYEVLFKGRPHDPMKFLKAGRHVFQS